LWPLPLFPGIPIPVEQTNVSIASGEITLSGVLLSSDEGELLPGIVFVPGSGPGERSELLEIATRFAENGLAVLVYDKRGSGQSEGDWVTSSLHDLAADAAAAYRFLVEQPQVDSMRSGFWGISQGGWIVPLAADIVRPAFVIVISGGGLPPRDVETAAYRAAVKAKSESQVDIDNADVVIDTYFDYLANRVPRERLMDAVKQYEDKAWLKAMGLRNVIPSETNRGNWEWVATFDPQTSIRKLTAPVLVLLGADDPLSPMPETARAWRESIAKDIATSRVIVFDNAGHGLRTEAHGGELMADYFATQFLWLREIAVLEE
jgi:pimeloyl-ACP methyl ester carboxylesterase